MMELLNTSISYNIDGTGNTSSVIAVNGGWSFTAGKISSVSTQFNQSETGTYVNANVTATESDFSDKKLDDVTMSEAQSVLQSILKNELPTS